MSDFAMIDLQGTDSDLAFRDTGVSGSIVAHENDVVSEVEGIVLGE